MIGRIINKIKDIYHRSSSDRYCEYLRKKGISIGSGTHICAGSATIDFTRPSLVSIGDNCYINENFTLLTHDYVTKVFLHLYGEFINSSGRVTIGNNVSFGRNVTVLKGVTIGDNCFIGAGSIVTKDIPPNSVAVGIPCKRIMSIDEYYARRQKESLDEALDYARIIQERFHRRPQPHEFWEEFRHFVDGENAEKHPEIPIKRQMGDRYTNYVKMHKAQFSSFDDFLHYAGIE